MENKKNVLWKLFISALYLSAFTFGGGYVIVTLMKKNLWMIITGLKRMRCWIWLQSRSHRRDRIAVNGAIVVGYKLAGMPGVLVAIIGTIIPPFFDYICDFGLLQCFPQQLFCEPDVGRYAGWRWRGYRICDL